MYISKIPMERLTKSEEATLVLRDGQIVQGKINKIYPNNRAEVQIGSHRFVAEIKTPLEVGQRYIFQVGTKQDGTIQLQVISNNLGSIKPENIVSLLNQLQIKVNDSTISFVQSLLHGRIPFSKQNLMQAVRMMDLVGHTREVQSMLKQMILQKLPLEENVLRALLAFQHHNLSNSMKLAIQELNSLRSSSATMKLQSLIENLIHPTVTRQLDTMPKEQLRQLILSFSILRYLPLSNNQEVERYLTHLLQDNTPKLVQDLQTHLQNDARHSDIIKLMKQYKPITQITNQMLLEFQLTQSKQLPSEQFMLLKQKITNELLPLLPSHEQQIIRTLVQVNNHTNIDQLQSLLRSFQSQHFYSVLMEALGVKNDHQIENSGLHQQRFLLHVQQLLQSLGTNNEALIKQFVTQQENVPLFNVQQTIKALLLQVIQEERAPLESMQQLVHYINGLQLQTREENNIFQVYLQLPGAKLGLPDDLFMQFESRKTKDDKIDADFCRILFFLQLNHLKETIIDMNIQKRIITLTIYNEFSDHLPKRIKPLREALSKGLERIDYRLSNIRFKPLNEEIVNQKTIHEFDQVPLTNREGFDFRI